VRLTRSPRAKQPEPDSDPTSSSERVCLCQPLADCFARALQRPIDVVARCLHVVGKHVDWRTVDCQCAKYVTLAGGWRLDQFAYRSLQLGWEPVFTRSAWPRRCLPVVPSKLSEPDCSFKKREFRGPGREPAASTIVVEIGNSAHQCGVGGSSRELFEVAIVNVKQLVSPARDFEPCRAQEERPEAHQGFAAAVGREGLQPIARLVVRRRATGINRQRRCRRRERRRLDHGLGRPRAAYGLRRQPLIGSGRGRFQTSCFFARPVATSNRAMLTTIRTLVYVS
jgi:hypothetical protein